MSVTPSLDREVAAVLELQRSLQLPAIDSLDPAGARRLADQVSSFGLAPAPMADVIDTMVAGGDGALPLRIYVPPDAGPHWIVYFHGGGGVIGSIDSYDPVTRQLAAQTRCVVASVGYRLAPEHRHPAAIEDAHAAWAAITPLVRRGGRIAVAGDSFGGFLSAHVDRLRTPFGSAARPGRAGACDHHAPATGARGPDVQVLIYPLVDLTFGSPSIDRLAERYLLTKSLLHWFRDHYLGDSADRRASSPAFWPDLSGSAPAIVVTAGFDPLVDEGNRHADRLRRAGVAVRHRRHPSLIHGFLSFAGGVRAAREALDEICNDLVELLG